MSDFLGGLFGGGQPQIIQQPYYIETPVEQPEPQPTKLDYGKLAMGLAARGFGSGSRAGMSNLSGPYSPQAGIFERALGIMPWNYFIK